MDLVSLLTGMNMTLAVAIMVVTSTLKVALKHDLKRPLVQRLLPLLPLVLGAGGGAAGAVDVNPVTMTNQIIAGLMVAGVSMIVFKVGKTTVAGRGINATNLEQALDVTADEQALPDAPADKEE